MSLRATQVLPHRESTVIFSQFPENCGSWPSDYWSDGRRAIKWGVRFSPESRPVQRERRCLPWAN